MPRSTVGMVIPYYDCLNLGIYKNNLMFALERLALVNDGMDIVVSECVVGDTPPLPDLSSFGVKKLSCFSSTKMWHKEHLINMGWKELNTDIIGWIDADVLIACLYPKRKIVKMFEDPKVMCGQAFSRMTRKMVQGTEELTREDYDCKSNIVNKRGHLEKIRTAGGAWVYDKAFTNVGMYPYHCVGGGDTYVWRAIGGWSGEFPGSDKPLWEGRQRYREDVQRAGFTFDAIGIAQRFPITILSHGTWENRRYGDRLLLLAKKIPVVQKHMFSINNSGGMEIIDPPLKQHVEEYMRTRQT